MNLIGKVKALFEAEKEVILAETIFVKTIDGKIFLVKSPSLALEAEVVMIDEAGAEVAIENGEYTLEDNSIVTVMDGKIAEIATKEEEAPEEEMEVTDETEVKLEVIPAGEYKLENGDVIVVDENQLVISYVKAEAPVVEEEMEVIEEVIEEVKEVAVDMTIELENKLKELEAVIESKDKEILEVRESFNKLKSEPAAKPLDVKKFEKNEKTNAQPSMLSRVTEIVNRNK